MEPAALSAEGRRLGPYRVLNELGRGGMAVVYRAVRDDDLFQKTVAVKLMSGGAGASENLLRRFSQERRILGRLQHSNIAAVFDGGATSEGQPYLVMELVEGRPITKYCDAHDLTTRERLEMFRDVCAAVQYAHQNLVIHRDLKPGNILVNEKGEPKLLDFGIAKLLAGADGEEAPTQTMAPMMTPEYASPEQVRGEAITTSSDIYSLGVLLFELLTGELPYPIETGSLQEIVRSVCEVEPPAPSTIARKRATVSALRGDLDMIVLKALRKEPQRRYVSVHELAEDIRHHLEGRPIAARSDSLAYRFAKFAGRNRAAAIAAGLVLLSLLAGIVVSLGQARRAELERARAERRFADVRQLANSLLFELHDAIASLPGSTPARELLVTRATEYLTSLSREAETDPDLQRELAAAYQRLGDVQGNLSGANLGDSEGALASYEKSLELRRSLTARGSHAPVDAERLAFLLSQMGRFFTGTGDWNRAEESAREAISLLKELASKAPEEDFRGRLAAAHHTLGYVLLRNAKPDDAYEALRTAANYSRDFAAEHEENPDAVASLAYIETDLSESLRLRGELQEAASVSQESSRLFRDLLEKDPSHPRYRRGLVVALSYEADALDALGEHRPAVDVRERAVEASRSFLASDERRKRAFRCRHHHSLARKNAHPRRRSAKRVRPFEGSGRGQRAGRSGGVRRRLGPERARERVRGARLRAPGRWPAVSGRLRDAGERVVALGDAEERGAASG